MSVRKLENYEEQTPRKQAYLLAMQSRHMLVDCVDGHPESGPVTVSADVLWKTVGTLQDVENILWQMDNGEWAGQPKDLQQYVKKLTTQEIESLLILLKIRIEKDSEADIQYGLSKDEREMVKAGQIIQAIKAIRERTEIGLKEAKDLADGYAILIGKLDPNTGIRS